MDTKTSVLKMLREADGYVSGQGLCEALGVSRTAVWKCVNQLKLDGYEFDAVSNKGYRIVKYPDILTKEEIESMLDTAEASEVKKVEYFDVTDSTNTRAKLAAEAGEPSGTLFIAESQTGGKGRRGRNWVSPAGSGIWMSLLLRPEIMPYAASMLTIMVAMALASAIEENIDDDTKCFIKWPNDIVMGERKICGILTEMSAELEQINYVVVGIGINVNTTEFDESIRDMASSIYLQTGIHIKRSDVVAAFARTFTGYYREFLGKCDLSGLVTDYNAHLINAGREVRIIERDAEYTATAVGIDETGELIVKLPDGTPKRIVSGEVSVRGLYGYV